MGASASEAVYNAVMLEEIAHMALLTERICPEVHPASSSIRDKHYYRKHGEGAYYGQ